MTAAILALSVSRSGSPLTDLGAFETKRLCDRISQLGPHLHISIDASALVACE